MSQDRKLHAKPGDTLTSAHSSMPRPSTNRPTFEPRTALGKELWALRQKIVASGEPLLNADEVDREVTLRRGGIETSD